MDYEKLNRERFGRRLSLARKQAGLAQKGLAFLTHFTQSEIAFYETGKRTPKDGSCICTHQTFGTRTLLSEQKTAFVLRKKRTGNKLR